MTASIPPRAFAMLLLGNAALAFGPWLVRLSDVGPSAAAFWRLALAPGSLTGVEVWADGNASVSFVNRTSHL